MLFGCKNHYFASWWEVWTIVYLAFGCRSRFRGIRACLPDGKLSILRLKLASWKLSIAVFCLTYKCCWSNATFIVFDGCLYCSFEMFNVLPFTGWEFIVCVAIWETFYRFRIFLWKPSCVIFAFQFQKKFCKSENTVSLFRFFWFFPFCFRKWLPYLDLFVWVLNFGQFYMSHNVDMPSP